ncbi:hypothetical protein [Vibrio splendidus]|uniref:hypothetical protein n=1 Tax=Vibrio splendidus TaxID=29497 RepID=UPI003D0F4996
MRLINFINLILIKVIVFASSSSMASTTHNSTIADSGISLIKHIRLGISVLWNARIVLGLLMIIVGFVGWYRAAKQDEHSSVVWPIGFSIVGAFLTINGGIDYFGEVLGFSGGADALNLTADGRANLAENTTYQFNQGSNTE